MLPRFQETVNVAHAYADHLYQPDVHSASLYLEVFGRKGKMEPERRLMLAVLGEALSSLARNGGVVGKRRLSEQREAVE